MGARVRAAALRKIPYVAVIGAREAADGRVALRLRDGRQLDPMPVADADLADRGVVGVPFARTGAGLSIRTQSVLSRRWRGLGAQADVSDSPDDRCSRHERIPRPADGGHDHAIAVRSAARPPLSPRPARAAVVPRTLVRLACRPSMLRWSNWPRTCTARGPCLSGRWPPGSPRRQHATCSLSRFWRARPRRSNRRRPMTRRRPRRTVLRRAAEWERGRAAYRRSPTGRRPLGDPDASPRTVQNLLFVLGAVLLGVAAIVFTAVAWTSYGVGGRAAILGGATLIAFAIPVIAVRRRLTATAETFTAIALLLLILDGYGHLGAQRRRCGRPAGRNDVRGRSRGRRAGGRGRLRPAHATDRAAVRGDHRGAAGVAAVAREPSDVGRPDRDLFRRGRLGQYRGHCVAPSCRPDRDRRPGALGRRRTHLGLRAPGTGNRDRYRRSRAWRSAIHIGSVLGAATAVAVAAARARLDGLVCAARVPPRRRGRGRRHRIRRRDVPSGNRCHAVLSARRRGRRDARDRRLVSGRATSVGGCAGA